jgi:hypothetical protein
VHQAMMDVFYSLLFITFLHLIFADQYINNCPLRLSDYTIIENVDYQPASSLTMVSQLITGSMVSCGYECLANTYCLTAAYKINNGQCTLYFEQTTAGHLIPSAGEYVLSTNGKIPGTYFY